MRLITCGPDDWAFAVGGAKINGMQVFLAQVPDSLSGGAGWIGAGLLGAVLCWLLLKHLPAKDTQLEKLINDNAVRMERQHENCTKEHEVILNRCDKMQEMQSDRHSKDWREFAAVVSTELKGLTEAVKQSRNS